MATDPVCGMAVDERTSELSLVRDGRTYYFCCSACLTEFADPARAGARLARTLLIVWPLSLAVLLLTYLAPLHPWVYLAFLLASIVQLYGGRTFYEGALDAVRSRVANMDLLVAIGSTLAYGYSVAALALPTELPSVGYFDASSMILTLILTGHYLERRTRARASGALGRLAELLPAQVEVVRGGHPVVLDRARLSVGDRCVVSPGGRFPADGRVVDGRSEADESPLTGESRPVPKSVGDPVIAGALNGSGRLEILVERVGETTYLSEIGRLLAEAESGRLPLRPLADRIAARFVPFVLAVAVAASILWGLLGAGPAVGLLVLVSVTITACPCAFGLATPAALLVGAGRAAESGVLFRGADAIERAAHVDAVVFDKTGTLTRPASRLVSVRPEPGVGEEELLRLVAGLEASIAHPVARAIRGEAAHRGIAVPALDGIRTLPDGVEGSFHGIPASVRTAASPSASGGGAPSWVEVRMDGRPLGRLGFEEELADGASEAVTELARTGIRIAIVTGDSEAAARAVADRLGIREVHARQTPGGKVEILARLRSEGRTVAFVGDGVNDAPALAAASLGMAVGGGTDVAREAGQVLLVRDDLRSVPLALAISRRTVAKVRQNLGWAIGYNAILLPVAAGALVPVFGLPIFQVLPIAGALAMGLSSTLVLANSLSLRRTIPVLARPRAVRAAGSAVG